jgi:hypothetical protein
LKIGASKMVNSKFMNTKSTVVLLALLLLMIYQQVFPQQRLLTVKKYYLPGEDTPFFKRGNDIEVIDDIIFVLENINHHILTYSINSKDELIFKGFLAEKGQGPGDLVLPMEMSIWDDKVAVIDGTALSFFSKQGKFLNKFRFFDKRVSFVYTANKIYLANSNPGSLFLINVYSTDGEKLFQCGENLLPVKDEQDKKLRPGFMKSIFYMGKLVPDGKQVFYFNNPFGKVFVFDLDGKIIKTKDIVPYFDPGLSSEIQESYSRLQKNGIKREKDGSIRVVTPTFFKDVYLCNDKIYILNSLRESRINPHIKIRVLDKNSLELLTTLLIKKNSDEERIRSIAVKEVKGNPVIFAAMQTEEGSVIAKF